MHEFEGPLLLTVLKYRLSKMRSKRLRGTSNCLLLTPHSFLGGEEDGSGKPRKVKIVK